MIDMREALAGGRTTSAELIERAIVRVEAVNPQLNLIAGANMVALAIKPANRGPGRWPACRR
jgi:Asp-tRNA(Asn)/Glu-tRNA(Gln) amidotransferase A subunit family amidase